MKLKYCYECESSKHGNLHYWIKTETVCKCKYCKLEAPKEDAKEILGE